MQFVDAEQKPFLKDSSDEPQRNLFGNTVSVTPQSLAEMDIDPAYLPSLQWLACNNTLTDIVRFALRQGVFDDAKNTVEYLAAMLENPHLPLEVSLAPTRGSGRSTAPLDQFRIPSKRENHKVPLYRHGTLGHAVVSEIAAGNIPARLIGIQEQFVTDEQGQFIVDEIPFSQGNDSHLLQLADSREGHNGLFDFNRADDVMDAFALQLRTALDQIIAEPATFGTPIKETDLYQLLRWALPDQVDQLFATSNHDPLTKDTLRSWAQLILYEIEQQGVGQIFSEIPVFKKDGQNPNGGRIDAITIASVNGQPLTPGQEEQVTQLRKQKYSSVAEFYNAAERALGGTLSCLVTDWKFKIGDGPNATTPVDLDTLEKPLPSHERQAKWYPTLAETAVFLSQQDREQESDPFAKNIFNQWRLVYIGPDQAPIEFRVPLDTAAQRDFFRHTIIPAYDRSEKAAEIKMYAKQMANELHEILAAENRMKIVMMQPGEAIYSTTNDSSGQMNNHRVEPYVVRLRHSYGETFADIVERMRFIDENRIIAVDGRKRDGNARYRVRFDALLRAIDDGKIGVVGFYPDRGGFSQCLFPDHDDQYPSSHYWINKNAVSTFHCFGCGKGGIIDQSSIPQDLAVQEKATSKVSIIPRTKEQPLQVDLSQIPEEHITFMGRLQDVLQQNFDRSPQAQAYIEKERGIDLDVARDRGVGYGSFAVIRKLLDDGFSLDDLRHYGVVGFTPNYRERNQLRDDLRKLGLSLDQIMPVGTVKRKVGQAQDAHFVADETVLSIYTPFSDVVTFGLGYEKDKFLNIYGRKIWPSPRRFRHMKLSVRETGVPHGLLFPQALNSTEGYVIICEGALDKLSLDMMGYENSIAMIGTLNRNSLAVLASQLQQRPEMAVGIGLDNDSDKNDRAGWRQADAMINTLRSFGCTNEFFSFTQSFIDQNPGMADVKDFNEYLLAARSAKPIQLISPAASADEEVWPLVVAG